jgi:hypothetical protein
MMRLVLLRLAYLGITNAFALLRLLPGGDRDKDIEILSLRQQLAVLPRQLDGQRVRIEPVDRAWLAALLHPLPRPTLRRLRLLVRPDTIVKWHRDLIARRHAAVSRARRRGRPRTLRSIRVLVLRLARDNGSWGIAGCTANCSRSGSPSTRPPSGRSCARPDRPGTRPGYHRLDGLPAFPGPRAAGRGLIETVTLTGIRMYILTVIEHASRRIRVLGATAIRSPLIAQADTGASARPGVSPAHHHRHRAGSTAPSPPPTGNRTPGAGRKPGGVTERQVRPDTRSRRQRAGDDCAVVSGSGSGAQAAL